MDFTEINSIQMENRNKNKDIQQQYQEPKHLSSPQPLEQQNEINSSNNEDKQSSTVQQKESGSKNNLMETSTSELEAKSDSTITKKSFEQILVPNKPKKRSFKFSSELVKKASSLETNILKKFNFFPIAERLKFKDYGYKLVKEYVRFIIIKVLAESEDSNQKMYPPPLINSMWLEHILDTSRYDEFCNLFKLKVHYNPEILVSLPIEEKKKRFYDTIEMYSELFDTESRNEVIWDDEFLNDVTSEQCQLEEDDYNQDLQQIVQDFNDRVEDSQFAQNNNHNNSNRSGGSDNINSEDNRKVLESDIENEQIHKKQRVESNNSDNNEQFKDTASGAEIENTAVLDLNSNEGNSNIQPNSKISNHQQLSPSSQKSSIQNNINNSNNDNPPIVQKIDLAFVYYRDSVKEITNFRGVGYNRPLSKVINTYIKLKGSDFSTKFCSYYFGNKEIYKQSPNELGMKSGDSVLIKEKNSNNNK